MSVTLRTHVELRDPKTLKPYERNNKKHPENQIDELIEGFKKYGFDQPIVIDKNNVVVKGHGRLKASLKIKLKQVPCIVVDDLTAEEVRGSRLFDNEISKKAETDLEAVKFELYDLADLGYDLTLTGFDELELENLLSDLPTTEFQPSQVFGGYGDEGEEFGGAPVQAPVGAKYPLSVVLSSGEFQRWREFKERIGERQDTKAFIRLLEGE